MDDWYRFEAAKKDVAAFEGRFSALKDALVSLGRILKESGWQDVKFAGSGEDDEITFAAMPPIERKTLELIPSLVKIIDEYGALVRKRDDAFKALPQSLQDELTARSRPRPR
jgi:hypothetical protein